MSEKTIEERLMETNLQLLKEKEDLQDKVEGWKAQDAEGNRLLAKERAKVEELETAIANYYRSNCGGYKNVEKDRAVELFVDENTYSICEQKGE